MDLIWYDEAEEEWHCPICGETVVDGVCKCIPTVLVSEIMHLRYLLGTSQHALQSYQYGNSSPDLAKEVTNKIQKYFDENKIIEN